MTNYLFEHIASIDVAKPADVCFHKFVYICTEEKKIVKCKHDFSDMFVYDVDEEPC